MLCMASTVGFRIRRASSASRSSTSAVELAMSAKRMVTFFLSPSCAPRTRLTKCCGVWTCAELSEGFLCTLASQPLALVSGYQNCGSERGLFGRFADWPERGSKVWPAKIRSWVQNFPLLSQMLSLGTTAGHASANEVRTAGRLATARSIDPMSGARCAASFVRRTGGPHAH